MDVLTRQSTLRPAPNQYNVNVDLESRPPYTHLDTGGIDELDYNHNNANPIISLSNTSLFVNDDWKVRHSLTLNAGLRWEYDPPPSVGPLGTLALQGTSLAPATLQAAISNAPLYNVRHDNFAPRFGFAWSPTRGHESPTVVRGGLGIYFDTGQAATAAGVTAASYPYESTATYLSPLTYSSINWTGLAAVAPTLPLTSVRLIDPNIILPRTYEWSLTVEQEFGSNTKLSTSYVGNDGERLAGSNNYSNTKNAAGQYPINTTLVKPNGTLSILTNQTHSNYHALQLQLTSRIGERFSALASYTWAHAEDNGSTDFSAVGATAVNLIADSAYDIRHIFSAAIHYAPTGFMGNRVMRAVTGGWGLDTIGRLQTASPFTVTVSNPNPTAFLSNADVVAAQPAYLYEHVDSFGKVVPGNKLLNHAAFTTPPRDSTGNPLRNGNSPVNGYRLFGLTQWDVAASRSWKIWEQLALDFRVDAFNILNTANFAAPSSSWSTSNTSTFGRASNTYAGSFGAKPSQFGETGAQLSVFQNGGPREVQLSMKLKF